MPKCKMRGCQAHRDQQTRARSRLEEFDAIDTLDGLKDWIRLNLWKETP